MAATALGRATSISIRRNPGSMFRSSGRTGSTCSSSKATCCSARRCSRRTPSPSPAISAADRRSARSSCIPSGRFAYVANRASSTDQSGVFVGGENTLAVFAIDRASGEPQIIQHVDTRGIHCRNFHIDPSGRLLVASHIRGLPVRDGGGTRLVPACLSVFRIGEDGRLEFVRKYDVETGDRQMFWMGMVGV